MWIHVSLFLALAAALGCEGTAASTPSGHRDLLEEVAAMQPAERSRLKELLGDADTSPTPVVARYRRCTATLAKMDIESGKHLGDEMAFVTVLVLAGREPFHLLHCSTGGDEDFTMAPAGGAACLIRPEEGPLNGFSIEYAADSDRMKVTSLSVNPRFDWVVKASLLGGGTELKPHEFLAGYKPAPHVKAGKRVKRAEDVVSYFECGTRM